MAKQSALVTHLHEIRMLDHAIDTAFKEHITHNDTVIRTNSAPYELRGEYRRALQVERTRLQLKFVTRVTGELVDTAPALPRDLREDFIHLAARVSQLEGPTRHG